ncbi:MAG TPA: nitroreductase family protein [Bacteroidales bacterium]|nr:nitroreductase family protein [Bacteroidales bacterium]
MMHTILNHRTIRKYKTTPVSQKMLEEILLAGTKASNTGNMQTYSMIVTTDSTLKEQLCKCHFGQEMVKVAPVLITFCADFNRFNKWCNLRKAKPGYDNFLSFFNAAIDALLVAQNVALAAEEKGLGICYLGTTTYNAKQIIDILNLPKGVVPVTTIVMGYPEVIPDLTDRLPLEAVVHYEKYQDYSDEKINELYSEKEALPFHQELLKINNKETLAQIFTDIRYKKADNIAFSKAFLKAIEDQMFMNNE